MPRSPRIALLHATSVAIAPIESAFQESWPEAEISNILDDGLTIDRAKEGDTLSDRLINRFVEFGRYAVRAGADGILVTCSAFGTAIDRMALELRVPVVKPNEAMFEAALDRGAKIGMLATFAPSVSTMEAEFYEYARVSKVSATLKVVLVEEAMSALRNGDVAKHNHLLAEHVSEFDDVDAVMLAHFSTSRAAADVAERTLTPILSAPYLAVSRIRSLLTDKV